MLADFKSGLIGVMLEMSDDVVSPTIELRRCGDD